MGLGKHTIQCYAPSGGERFKSKSFAAYRPAGGTFLNNRCRVSALLMEISLTKGKLMVNGYYLQKVKFLHGGV